jgi:hypothetical protein
VLLDSENGAVVRCRSCNNRWTDDTAPDDLVDRINESFESETGFPF